MCLGDTPIVTFHSCPQFTVASVGLKMDDGTITTDPGMKAEIFNNFLAVYSR